MSMAPSETLKEGGPAPKLAGGFTCAAEPSWLSPYHQGYVLWGDFPGGSVAETLAPNAGGPGSIPGPTKDFTCQKED